ncbi:MAG: DNA primase [Gammaproteobacteria bacterium]|nr:DNA primase [Gammaproteobacteria bacterium]MCP4088521.1 DNA primase [Gammaproteobacteria bacterium]MCP4276739.1 DNA primase [Gammaproteobacteria bacterium]MCP4833060.1 DNA primase [Gammaproteobacteria bacterium]MCP4928391.1 DNA primase [Gammaproteobacteria bacterium]
MAGRIPQDFINDLIDRSDIVEILQTRIQLKKAGREYKACCPFHGEKTPSFTVSPEKGFYHCFGCGAHGTVIGFLMEHDRLEFVEAVEELASINGVDVVHEAGNKPTTPAAPLYELLDQAAQLFREELRSSDKAITYLKQRHLDGETAGRFRIGYAPGGWNYLLKHFGGSETGQEHLLKTGMILRNEEGRVYDRFRDRIMFPIRDSRGRVVGFGGRVLDHGEPKYLNSPETPVFHKGRELYGLYEARRANRKLKHLLVVEGYMDVVALACHGINNAVATLGTATTTDHLQRLFRATNEIIFCFDGDRAGRDAAWRALQITLPELREGRQARFLFLADGQDPDSVVSEQGAEAFNQQLAQSLPLSDYLLQQLKSGIDLSSVDGLARLAELARPMVNLIPEGVYRELLLGRLADEIGLSTQRLATLLDNPPAANPTYAAPRSKPKNTTNQRSSHIRHAIKLVLHHPAAAKDLALPEGFEALTNPGISLLKELLTAAAKTPKMKPGRLAENFAEHQDGGRALQTLLTQEVHLDNESNWDIELRDTLNAILREALEYRHNELIAQADSPDGLSDTEKTEFRELPQQLARLRHGIS